MERIDELHAYVKDVPWVCFEAVEDGNITISNIVFSMRIGSHMRKPMRAIIAEQMFVKMALWKSEPEMAGLQLRKLDARVPELCLYDAQQDFNQFYQSPVIRSSRRWHPPVDYYYRQQQQLNAQLQTAQQAAIGSSGAYYSGTQAPAWSSSTYNLPTGVYSSPGTIGLASGILGSGNAGLPLTNPYKTTP